MDIESVRMQTRRLVQRIAYFVKPAPVYKPLAVDDILGKQTSMDVVDRFNDLWYKSGTPGELNWRGDTILKNPCDLWMVLELFQRIRPSVLIETGTHRGGSASFYADMLHVLGIDATVITIDLNPKWSFDPRSKNIVSVVGYSTDPNVVAQVEDALRRARAKREGAVMVMLDSDHSQANVGKELELYSPYVTVGSYLIVEDTNVNGHPSSPDFGPGPWEAADAFLKQQANFVVDRECERFLLTFFPRGWLKRVS